MSGQNFSPVLAVYMARKFLLFSALATIGLTCLISLFDFLDLLRKAAPHPEADALAVSAIALLHMPHYVIYVLSFGILLGSMVCLSSLTRHAETVAGGAAGQSLGQMLLGPVIGALLLGLTACFLLSPLEAFSGKKAALLEARSFESGRGKPVRPDIWLREPESAAGSGPEIFLRLGSPQIVPNGNREGGPALESKPATFFLVDRTTGFRQRLEAQSARLENHRWTLSGLIRYAPPAAPRQEALASFPSSLNPELVRAGTDASDTLSFWRLPGVISRLHLAGFRTTAQALHFQTLLALPLLAATMVLIAAGFCISLPREGKLWKLAGYGALAGFGLFAVSKTAEQLGKTGALPPALAAWAPVCAGLCLATTLLLHRETH